MFLYQKLIISLFFIGLASNSHADLTFGLHPYLLKSQLIKRFTPLINYLSEQMGETIHLKIAKNYTAHESAVGQDQVDIAYLGPIPYIKMVNQYGKKPVLACIEVNGKPTFRGAIIVRQESPLTTLADLKGKRFAFGDPSSTMANLIPRYELLKAGVSLQQLGYYDFLDNHEQIVFAILLGEYDAGAVKEDMVYKYQNQGLKVLHWTMPVTTHIFVTRQKLPKEKIARLRTLLLSLSQQENGMAILQSIKSSITGILPAEDKDYDNLRAVLARLKTQEANN